MVANAIAKRLKDLPTQLRLLYGDINNIEVICAQHQGYNATATANCAIFTIANTIMLLKNQDPCEYTLLKNMRKQLIDMLNAGVFQPFLAIKRDHPLTFTNENKYARVRQQKIMMKEKNKTKLRWETDWTIIKEKG